VPKVNPLSGIIGEAWRMYRAHLVHLLTIAFVVYVVATVVQALLTAGLGWVGALISAAVGLLAGFFVQAALVRAVEDLRDGRADLSLGGTFRAALPALGRVTVTSILAAIAITIGFVLLIAPGLFLLTIWAVIVPVLVIEGAGVGRSFDRSRELVRGYGWHVFATIVIVFLLGAVAGIILELLLFALPDEARTVVSGLVSGTLFAPFSALVVTLGYYRLLNAHSSTPQQA
jgi:hypothetical protein